MLCRLKEAEDKTKRLQDNIDRLNGDIKRLHEGLVKNSCIMCMVEGHHCDEHGSLMGFLCEVF